jgi:hypothetical protein
MPYHQATSPVLGNPLVLGNRELYFTRYSEALNLVQVIASRYYMTYLARKSPTLSCFSSSSPLPLRPFVLATLTVFLFLSVLSNALAFVLPLPSAWSL